MVTDSSMRSASPYRRSRRQQKSQPGATRKDSRQFAETELAGRSCHTRASRPSFPIDSRTTTPDCLLVLQTADSIRQPFKGCGSLSRRLSSDSPNGVANIIRHQQCAVTSNRYTNGTAHRFAFWRDETGQYVDWNSRWASACKWYEYHPVTAERFSVP